MASRGSKRRAMAKTIATQAGNGIARTIAGPADSEVRSDAISSAGKAVKIVGQVVVTRHIDGKPIHTRFINRAAYLASLRDLERVKLKTDKVAKGESVLNDKQFARIQTRMVGKMLNHDKAERPLSTFKGSLGEVMKSKSYHIDGKTYNKDQALKLESSVLPTQKARQRDIVNAANTRKGDIALRRLKVWKTFVQEMHNLNSDFEQAFYPVLAESIQ